MASLLKKILNLKPAQKNLGTGLVPTGKKIVGPIFKIKTEKYFDICNSVKSSHNQIRPAACNNPDCNKLAAIQTNVKG